MSTTQKTSKRYEESKASIIAAAIGVINQKGVGRMTLAEVAEKLGFAAPAITYYYKKKDDLAVACLLKGVSRMEEFIGASEKYLDTRTRIESLFNAFLEFKRRGINGEVEEFPSFSDARALDDPALNQAYLAMFNRMRDLLKGTGHEKFQGKERSAIAHILTGELNWIAVWYFNFYPEAAPRYCRRYIDILAQGIAEPGFEWTAKELPSLLPHLDAADGASKELFLRAASAQINELGYRGTSVDKIAARLNLTKGAFYHHVDNKDDLVLACFKRTFEVMHRAIDMSMNAAPNGLQTLSTFVCSLIRHQIDGDASLLRASAIYSVLPSAMSSIIIEIQKVTDRIASVVSDGIIDGSVRRVDANITAQMIIALVNSADELTVYLPDTEPSDMLDLYVRPIFTGIFRA